MSQHLEKYKPAASARMHLVLAASLWSAVGTGLLWFGVRWASAGHLPAHWWLIAAAVCLGALKARYVLRRTAGRMIQRINERGDGRCIGGFLSVRSWLLVLAMMSLGRFLRHSALPRATVGLLYAMVGTALLLASGVIWDAWLHHRSEA